MRPTDWQCPYCTFTTRYRPNYVAHIACHRKIETVTGVAEKPPSAGGTDGVIGLPLTSLCHTPVAEPPTERHTRLEENHIDQCKDNPDKL